MKTLKLFCITLCCTFLFYEHTYSQVEIKTTDSVVINALDVPQSHRQVIQSQDANITVTDYSSANADVFTQKTFSAPLFDDPIAIEANNISPRSSFKNLEVYLIYGNAEIKKKYVPLQEALQNKMAKVDETSTVGKLSITNNSDQYIYINSGDIVKGGKQDRTIKYDIVVAPHAKNVDLASFCVESSRWSQRGSETSAYFSASNKSLSSSNLKVAARHNSNQSEVWSEVKSYQTTTNSNLNTDAQYIQVIHADETPVTNTTYGVNGNADNTLGDRSTDANQNQVDVTKNASSSSLELTLENKELGKVNEEYKKNIVDQFGNRDGAVGMAYFINGKLYNIEVFNNQQLFSDLFNKLIDAAIAEAISVTSTNAEVPQGDLQLVKDFLKADAKVYVEEPVNSITQARTSENNIKKDMWIFSTIDLEEKTWIHRNWIIK